MEVAECLSQSLGIEIYPECIEKVLETPELKDVTKHDERIRTLNNAFKVADKSIVEGRRILLFDDLYSSGATLNSIARELNQHGNVIEIFALTLTRTRRKK